jgi:HEAT repeat protein
MKKALIGGTVVIAVLLLGFFWFKRGEPLHKGKPARYWRTALKDDDPAVRREALVALGALKIKDAFPDMLAALSDKDPKTRAQAAVAIWSMGGAHAKEAVGALIPLLKDQESSVRLSAAGALGQIGPEASAAAPALKTTLKDSDPYVRAQAATALGQIRHDPAASSAR